jgi:hypothetical protein
MVVWRVTQRNSDTGVRLLECQPNWTSMTFVIFNL